MNEGATFGDVQRECIILLLTTLLFLLIASNIFSWNE